MLSFIIDLLLQSRQCVAQLLVHMQSLLYIVVYINDIHYIQVPSKVFFIGNYDCVSIILGFQLKLGATFRSRYSDVM